MFLHVLPLLEKVFGKQVPAKTDFCTQSVARLRNNRGGCVFRVRGDVTQRWVVVMWHVFPVMLDPSLAI
jgi:hypothetical protein